MRFGIFEDSFELAKVTTSKFFLKIKKISIFPPWSRSKWRRCVLLNVSGMSTRGYTFTNIKNFLQTAMKPAKSSAKENLQKTDVLSSNLTPDCRLTIFRLDPKHLKEYSTVTSLLIKVKYESRKKTYNNTHNAWLRMSCFLKIFNIHFSNSKLRLHGYDDSSFIYETRKVLPPVIWLCWSWRQPKRTLSVCQSSA